MLNIAVLLLYNHILKMLIIDVKERQGGTGIKKEYRRMIQRIVAWCFMM